LFGSNEEIEDKRTGGENREKRPKDE